MNSIDIPRLCDIPKYDMKIIQAMFSHNEHIHNGFIAYKKVKSKIMTLTGYESQQIKRIFGKFLQGDNENQQITWNTILDVMQEETTVKEELRDQKMFGQKKIFLKKEKKIDLTHPKYSLFGHNYPITYMKFLNFEKKSMVQIIINYNILVCMDENMDEIQFRLDFNIDYIKHYNKILDNKYKIVEEELKIRKNAEMRAKLQKNDSKDKKSEDNIDKKSPKKFLNFVDKNFCIYKYDNKHENLDQELYSGIKSSRHKKGNQYGIGKNSQLFNQGRDVNADNISLDENGSDDNLSFDEDDIDAFMKIWNVTVEKVEKTRKLLVFKEPNNSDANCLDPDGTSKQKNENQIKKSIQQSHQKNVGGTLRENGYKISGNNNRNHTDKSNRNIDGNRGCTTDKRNDDSIFNKSGGRNFNSVGHNKNGMHKSGRYNDNNIFSKNGHAKDPTLNASKAMNSVFNKTGKLIVNNDNINLEKSQNIQQKFTHQSHENQNGQAIIDFSNESVYLQKFSTTANGFKSTGQNQMAGFDSKENLDRHSVDKKSYRISNHSGMNKDKRDSRSNHISVIDNVRKSRMENLSHKTGEFNKMGHGKNGNQMTEEIELLESKFLQQGSGLNATGNKAVKKNMNLNNQRNSIMKTISNVGKTNTSFNKTAEKTPKNGKAGDVGERNAFAAIMKGNEQDSINKLMNDDIDLTDMLGNKVFRKYDHKKNNFEVDVKDQGRIHKLFTKFRNRTEDKKLSSITTNFMPPKNIAGKTLDLSFENIPTPKGMNDTAQSTEKGLEENLNKQMFKQRIEKFRVKISRFMGEADGLTKKLKTIGALINKGNQTEEEKLLYEELMRAFNAKFAKKNNFVQKTTKQAKGDIDTEMNDAEVVNKKKNKNIDDTMKMTCISQCYWSDTNFLVLGFLSREMYIYELNYEYKFEFRFMDEVRWSGKPSFISITKSVFHDCWFFIVILNDTLLKIYKFRVDLKNQKEFRLIDHIDETKVKPLYSACFESIKMVKNKREYTVISDMNNNVYVLKQVSPETFTIVKNINLTIEEPSKATVVTAIEISLKNGYIFIGTNSGEMYSYDIDIMNFSYKGRPFVDTIVELRFVEFLNNLYMISKTKSIKVYDVQRYNLVQHLNFYDEDIYGNWKWGYMADLDELFNRHRVDIVIRYHEKQKQKVQTITDSNASSKKDLLDKAENIDLDNSEKASSKNDLSIKDDEQNEHKKTNEDSAIDNNSKVTDAQSQNKQKTTNNNLNEEDLILEQKFDESAKALVVERLKETGLKFYVGSQEILEQNFHVKKREQFKEEIHKYTQLHVNENSLKIGNDEDRLEYYSKFVNKSIPFLFIEYYEAKKEIIMLNEKKFFIVYNIDLGRITRHLMIDLHGEIIKMQVTNKNSVMFANKKGECIVLSQEFLKIKFRFILPLSHVVSVEDIWNDSYRLAFIHSPNEIYYIKTAGRKTDYVYDSLTHREICSIKIKGCIKKVCGNKQVILLINDDLTFTLIKKKTMEFIRTFDFYKKLPKNVKAKFDLKGSVDYDIVKNDYFFRKQELYLQFDNGYIVKCMFDTNYTTKFDVIIIYDDARAKYVANYKTKSVYVLTSDFYYKKQTNLQLFQDDSFRRPLVDRNDLFNTPQNDDITEKEGKTTKLGRTVAFNTNKKYSGIKEIQDTDNLSSDGSDQMNNNSSRNSKYANSLDEINSSSGNEEKKLVGSKKNSDVSPSSLTLEKTSTGQFNALGQTKGLGTYAEKITLHLEDLQTTKLRYDTLMHLSGMKTLGLFSRTSGTLCMLNSDGSTKEMINVHECFVKSMTTTNPDYAQSYVIKTENSTKTHGLKSPTNKGKREMIRKA